MGPVEGVCVIGFMKFTIVPPLFIVNSEVCVWPGSQVLYPYMCHLIVFSEDILLNITSVGIVYDYNEY